MDNLGKLFFCIAFISLSGLGQSQSIESPYEVGTWQGFRSAAVTYTFDDNCPNQLLIAVPMFDEFDFKLTLFTVTNPSWGWAANWNGLQNAASEGHEIASHTVTHNSFSGMVDSLQENELKNSQDVINSHITGEQCVTIAYPYCNTGNNNLVRQYYFASRGCSGSTESKTPGNFMNISSIVCGSEGSIKTSANFKSGVDNATSTNGWVVYLFHGINGTEPGAYSPISEDTIRASLEYLKANPDKFWVYTFGGVAKYIRERNAASVSQISETEDSIEVSVTDTLDNSYYNCPITVRRPLPEGWASAVAIQNGITLTSKVVEVNSVKYIMFDVVPDGGDILLTKSDATGVSNESKSFLQTPYLKQNYPNPFNPITQIEYSVPKSGYISLKVYNLLGKEIAKLYEGIQLEGDYIVSLDGSALTSGVYFYSLQTNNFVDTKKLILLK